MHLMTRRSCFSSTSLFLTLVTWTFIDFYFSHSHVLVVDCIIILVFNLFSQEGNSALYIASQNGHVRTVEILLQKGAHTNSQNIVSLTLKAICSYDTCDDYGTDCLTLSLVRAQY